MIAKFETIGSTTDLSASNTTSTGGSGKMFLTLAIIGLVGYLGYKYVYLPSKEKKETENDNQRQAK